jgi:hypothetical protein
VALEQRDPPLPPQLWPQLLRRSLSTLAATPAAAAGELVHAPNHQGRRRDV